MFASGSVTAGVVTNLIATGAMSKFLQAESGAATLWRMSYQKTTPFAFSQEVVKAGGCACSEIDYSSSQTHSFSVSRSPDLIDRLFIKASLPAIASTGQENGAEVEYVCDAAEETAYGAGAHVNEDKVAYYKPGVGHYLIEELELKLGTALVDKMDGFLMHMLMELQGKAGQLAGLDEMVGQGSIHELQKRSMVGMTLYVPVPFYWSSGVSGLALPVVGLQFHDITVDLKTRAIADCISNEGGAILKQRYPVFDAQGALTRIDAGSFKDLSAAKFGLQVEARGIYLGQQERVRVAGAKQEILISQHQSHNQIKLSADGEKQDIDLRFNHAVSELLLGCPQNESLDFYGQECDVTGIKKDALETLSLSLNNQARTIADKEALWYRLASPQQFHANIPRSQIYSIPFALSPGNIAQPTGSLNFSRVDDCMLHVKAAPAAGRGDKLLLYARSWNIMRVQLGISGLAFSF